MTETMLAVGRLIESGIVPASAASAMQHLILAVSEEARRTDANWPAHGTSDAMAAQTTSRID